MKLRQMSLPITILLVLVIIVLTMDLFLIVRLLRKRRRASEDAGESETWSASCKACNTHIAFDAKLPL